eukprot:842921-Prorocentrum_minimum.AAC.1
MLQDLRKPVTDEGPQVVKPHDNLPKRFTKLTKLTKYFCHTADCDDGGWLVASYNRHRQRGRIGIYVEHNVTSFYGSSCANNGKGALNTP